MKRRDLLLPGQSALMAAMLVIVGASAVTLLGRRYAHQAAGGRLDVAVDLRVAAGLSEHQRFLRRVVDLGSPTGVVVLASVLLLVALLLRSWRGVLLVALGIPVATMVTEWLLKPHFHRTHGGGLAFPSGHTTGAFAVAVTLAVLLVGRPAARIPWQLRLLLAAAGLAVASGVAVSLVALGYHYATDTVGGAGVALTVVLGTALLIDRLPWRGPSSSR
jgi:membrane-associated phospholipid phosphatase